MQFFTAMEGPFFHHLITLRVKNKIVREKKVFPEGGFVKMS
jgi:hypothetical protein